MSVKDAVWKTDRDEAVEVNQRALIEKVLARYPGDFSVFRELLQNSDDARAKAVEIHFDAFGENVLVNASTGEMKSHGEILVDCWTVKNDGGLFRSEDWDRLRKIAEGNPDEQKIGAFGVGFYTVFSITDRPSVTSGGNCMEFYWKEHKDQLFVRTGTLHEELPSPWTTSRLPLREPSTMPVPFDLIRFLSSSIAFMTSIQTVSLFLNEICLAKLVREVKPSKALPPPKGLSPRTKRGFMVVKGVNIIPTHIHADILDWVHLVPEVGEGDRAIGVPMDSNASEPCTSVLRSTSLPLDDSRTVTSIGLSVFSADVSVKLSGDVLRGIYRWTKKNPPTEMRYDLVYAGYEEYEATMNDTRGAQYSDRYVFRRPSSRFEGGTARVIVGHATSQTTGIGGHMAARFIPTVEREAIDFAAEHVSVWNKALLEVGGILSRVAYEYELSGIEERWNEAARIPAAPESMRAIQNSLAKYALHALKFFTFHRSTPKGLFSRGIRDAFFACLPRFPVLSTRGVKASFEVCLPEPALSGFLKDLPVLPDDVVFDARDMVEILKARNYINHSVPDDLIIEQLARTPLKEGEMVACLQWLVDVTKNLHLKQGDPSKQELFQDRLISVATLSLDGSGNGTKHFTLSSIKHFMPDISFIPTDGPLPDSVLPAIISREFSPEDLIAIFHWRELSIEQWVMHISSKAVVGTPGLELFDITLDTQWAARALTVVNRGWPILTQGARESIRDTLAPMTCIPTTIGMTKPEYAYLPNVIAFPDLPIAVGLVGMDELLRFLGLKSRVALDMVFDRVFNTNQWTTAAVVNYLSSVWRSLTDEEMERLSSARVFPEAPRTSDTSGKARDALFVMSELHEPSDICQKLELPILDWDQMLKWDSRSPEAELLHEIGLRRSPRIEDLIQGCASAVIAIRRLALDYLIKNLSSTYSDYRPDNFSSIPFLPAIRNKQSIMGAPRDVVVTECWGEIGFDVLDPDYLIYASALQVQSHPGPDEMIKLLRTHPPMHDEEAAKIFSLMSPRTPDFTDDHRRTLSAVPFIPVNSARTGEHASNHLPPSRCFLGSSSHPVYSQVFTFVDFGLKANPFLAFCGVKEGPTTDEIADALAKHPGRFYKLCRGADGYLSELRNLAAKSADISSKTISRMKMRPFLLAIGLESKSGSKDKEECSSWVPTYCLKTASQIIVVDDVACYKLFKFEKDLFTAPQEDALERFYLIFGSRKLSKSVHSKLHASEELTNSKEADTIRALVLERLPLFLHENTLAKSTLAAQWDKNFVVRAFQALEVTKTLRIGNNVGNQWPSNHAAITAAAIRIGMGLELRICENITVDLYEVAQSINAHILKARKTNDDLLLCTILSTDITTLERRGYNITRILRQQPATVEGQLAQVVPPAGPFPGKVRQLDGRLATHPNSWGRPHTQAPPAVDSALPSRPVITVAAEKAHDHVQSLYSSARQSNGPKTLSPSLCTPSPPPAAVPAVLDPSLPSKTASILLDRVGCVPMDLISSNIALAVKACASGSRNLLREQGDKDREPPLSESYCDASGRNYNIQLLGFLENVPVVAPQDALPVTFIADNSQALVRFVCILLRLSSVFRLPQGSIHIVNDSDEQLVAFNRNAQIFLNFRHFQLYYDAQVEKAELNSAYIAWYFALAHEIAHNLVEAHNSKHEFYFTAICEKHLAGLVELLSS
ncbi:hypothetical protein BKA70DRAFT_1309603 [Coprinopsis sp. MPI-PUGE-AT-0042]|nr:hypothetical protein BKA70DRAFT_1309603 [Coprinopsis sp. MPI-PUGE-AT-0042]